jgi:hypothetical protein
MYKNVFNLSIGIDFLDINSNNISTTIPSSKNVIDKILTKNIDYLKNDCIFAMLLASNIIKI